jgi:hypothetical protein
MVAGDFNNRDGPSSEPIKRLVGRRQRRLPGERRLKERANDNKHAGDIHGF